MLEVTLKQARKMQILTLGLGKRKSDNPTKDDLLAEITRMGVLQIDTIHVVARSPYLVLWSRIGNYPQNWLDELLEEKKLFEYWAHAASFLPIEDYPLFRWEMDARSNRWNDLETWLGKNATFSRDLLEHVRDHGPVKSADFKRGDGIRGTWWDWKAEKIALEQLFLLGEIMIAKRERFQRVYDITERVLPRQNHNHGYTHSEAHQILIARTIRALGIALPKWIPDYYRLPGTGLDKTLKLLVEHGEVFPIRIAGIETPGYIHSDNLQLLESVATTSVKTAETNILSPFDPLVWDRARLKTLFGVEYRLECYLPKPKRKFGYWLLPILHKDAIIGKMDAKANRQRKVFEVKSLSLEDGVTMTEEMIDGLCRTLIECAQWHKTPSVEIVNCPDINLLIALRERISKIEL